MALQIEDLVASIRKEGVEAAQKDAEKILSEAKLKAEQIVKQAQKEAAQLKAETERQLSVRDQSARATLQQAGRDLQLSLKKAIESQLDRLLSLKVQEALDAKELASLIAQLVKEQMVQTKTQEIQVSEKVGKALSEALVASLGDELSKGLSIKPVKSVDYGFRISDKDGSGYFDFSATEIAKLLKPFLGDEIAQFVFSE